MDRNTITGLILIGAIMIGYFLWMSPSREELEAQQRKQDSIASVQAEESERKAERETVLKAREDSLAQAAPLADSASQASLDSVRKAALQAEYGAFATAIEGEEQFHTIGNDHLKLTLSNKGAAPVQAELLNYVTFDSLPLYLFDKETSRFNFSFWLNKSREVNSGDMYFVPVEGEMTPQQAVYRLYGQSQDEYLEVSYRIPEGESYLVDAAFRVVGMEQMLSASEEILELDWDIMAPFHERSREQEQAKTTVYYKYMEDKADYLSETDYEEEILEATTQWVAFKQQFFSAAIISSEGFGKENASVATVETGDPRYTKGLETSLGVPLSEADPSFDFQLYLGPNHYQTLADLGVGLEDQIDLGWAIFGWVNRWLVIPIFNFLDEYTALGYGIIILILTIIIKLLLFPLTWRNYVSSARMRVLKPEVDEINEKMKDKDPMQKQQAVMALYRQAGVNPMAGCVPMLLQLPILYAMFRFFPASIELRQEPFLWARDLSTYDSVLQLPFTVPLGYGDHVSLFTLLMAISTFFYSKYNMDMASGSSAQMPQMKIMIYLMPVMLLFFFNSYSAGLSYYYLAANVISMLQQFVIKKYFIDEEAIHQKIQANKLKPAKKSNFQKRLEKMAKDRGYQMPKK